MGKLILCSGKLAQKPFCFSLSKTNVYSIEELCFYIYHNIYTIGDELYQNKLVDWLKDEIDMPLISEKLMELMEGNHCLKDIVVSILCSADYYEEKEIKDLIVIMDQIDNLSFIRKLKIKADNYLRYKKHLDAAKIYEQILNSKEVSTLTPEEYGGIKHNLAIVYIHTLSYKKAVDAFLEAYRNNQRKESLKQYLFALKLGKYDEEFNQAIIEYDVSEEQVENIKSEIEKKILTAKETFNYKKIDSLYSILQEGKINEYYNRMDAMISGWKTEYRQGIL